MSQKRRADARESQPRPKGGCRHDVAGRRVRRVSALDVLARRRADRR
jgi:hypothetical protein